MAYKRKTTENTAELLKSGKKKWVRYDEGAELYSIGYHSFIRLAKEAGAVYHINRIVLVNVIKVVANENRYHPVLDYLNSLTWDGKERIRYALHHFLGAEVSDYTYEVMKLFMMGTISRVSCPGIKFESMLCLVGGQGAGKSTFLRFLAMKDDWFTDDLKKIINNGPRELEVEREARESVLRKLKDCVAILEEEKKREPVCVVCEHRETR